MSQLSLIKKRKKTPGTKWGRPPSTHTGARRKRDKFASRYPLHVTLRLRENLPNLRTRKGAQIVKHAIKGAQQSGIRIVHFAILSNHIHLIVEGKSPQTFYNSMKSFCSRLGIRLRRWADKDVVAHLDSKGLGLFRGRYHVQILKSPTEVKNALKYVLLNPAKHFKKGAYLDIYTSGVAFAEWEKLIGRPLQASSTLQRMKKALAELLSPPELWFTCSGWQRAGPS